MHQFALSPQLWNDLLLHTLPMTFYYVFDICQSNCSFNFQLLCYEWGGTVCHIENNNLFSFFCWVSVHLSFHWVGSLFWFIGRSSSLLEKFIFLVRQKTSESKFHLPTTIKQINKTWFLMIVSPELCIIYFSTSLFIPWN